MLLLLNSLTGTRSIIDKIKKYEYIRISERTSTRNDVSAIQCAHHQKSQKDRYGVCGW